MDAARLDALSVSLDHLVKLVEDRGLDTFDDAQLVGFLHSFEKLRNRLPLVDHATIGAAARRNLAETLCQSTLTRMLAVTLRISPGEAASRVRAAEALAERMSMTGEPLPPVRPHLAEAQRSGEVNPEQVSIIERALAKVDHRGFDPADLDAGERLLTEHAAPLGPNSSDCWPSGWWTRSTRTAPCQMRLSTVTAGSSICGKPRMGRMPGSSGSPVSAG